MKTLKTFDVEYALTRQPTDDEDIFEFRGGTVSLAARDAGDALNLFVEVLSSRTTIIQLLARSHEHNGFTRPPGPHESA